MKLRIQGLPGFRVQGLGSELSVEGLGFRVEDEGEGIAV